MEQTTRITWMAVWRHRGAGEVPIVPVSARHVMLVVALFVGGGVLLDALVANPWARGTAVLAVVVTVSLWTRREQMRAALAAPIHAEESRWPGRLAALATAVAYGWVGDPHAAAVFAAAVACDFAVANALQSRSVRRKQLRSGF